MVKKFIIIICSAVLIAANTVGIVAAQTGDVSLDVQRADMIRANCRSAQSTIQKVSRNDAALRINRGRAYEKMLKLMYSFNARVASNNKSKPELSELTASFEKDLNKFRTDYDQYADALQRTLKPECTNQPVTFYEALMDARTKRQTVNRDINELNKTLDQYQLVVNEISVEVGGSTK